MTTPDLTVLNRTYDTCWAVLVGVNEYVDPAISNLTVCAGDVQSVYDAITGSGYQPDRVKLRLSPDTPTASATRSRIFAALTSIAEAVGQDDLLLFYFSGHGIARDGQAYLLPSDTSYSAVADTAINLERVKQIVRDSPARAKVMILDACHAGAQIGKAAPQMTEDFIRHVFEEAEGLAILASCKHRQVSWEWPAQGQSVFTHYLLEGVSGAADFDRKGFVTVNDISRYVTDKVKTWAASKDRVQTPTLQSAVAGDIVLFPYAASAALSGGEASAGNTKQPTPDTTEGRDKEMHVMDAGESQTTITWLHLSDFHFSTQTTYNSQIVLDALLDDIAQCIQNDNLQPDFIVISGDIAFSGQPEEYDLAKEFLDRLLEVTHLFKEDIFIVPGNHDVDRNAIGTLAASAARLLHNRDAVNEFLTNESECELTFQRFCGYQAFIDEYLNGRGQFDHKRCFYIKEIQLGDRNIAVIGLNSAWLSASDEDRNQLILGEYPVREAIKVAEKADLRLAVMHHPFEWLRNFDRNDVEPLLYDKCDYVLHGHMHRTGLLQASTPDSRAMIIAAGACYETRGYPNSYNFVQLDFAACRGAAYLRMYSDQRGGFWTKDVTSYRNVDNGNYEFSIPNVFCGKNPFIYGRALRPEESLNRKSDLRSIFSRLRNGESTAVVGGPHVGKSSLLLKLYDQDIQQDYLGHQAQSTLTTYLDLHPVGDNYAPQDFWKDALKPIRDHSEEITQTDYTRRSLERQLKQLGRDGRRLILLLDEFERLLVHPNFQSPSFFALLRSLASRFDGLALVTASRESTTKMNERMKHLLGVGSPFFNIMIDMRLRPFEEPVIDKLLSRSGDTFSSADRLFIRRVAGRHPFLLQALAATLYDTTGDDRYARAAEDFYDRVVSHFDDLWNHMDDRTRTAAVVLSLAEMGGSGLPQAINCNDIEHADRFDSALKEMAKHGLAERVDKDWPFEKGSFVLWRGDRWTVEIQAFTWWICNVVVTESHRFSAYDAWLANRSYSELLTDEQWNRRVEAARIASDWAAQDVGAMANALFNALMRRDKL
jgi:predicted MPP superfamily phosphohydrolase